MESSITRSVAFPRVPAPPALTPEALAQLRAERPERCLVFASWAALEPVEGTLHGPAVEELRSRLIVLGALEIEPVLCLYTGESPDWFDARGGWRSEDNLRCYLRYVGRLLRAVGHLAEEYVTFYAPNALAWRPGLGLRGVGGAALTLSHLSCVHVRAYRLIRDQRRSAGLGETRVGFVLRIPPRRGLRRALSRGEAPGPQDRLYWQLPLLAMAAGEFSPPLRNVLRVQPGRWADFVGVIGPREEKDWADCLALAAAGAEAEIWSVEI